MNTTLGYATDAQWREFYEDKCRVQDKRIAALESSLQSIANLGGNLPDERLTDRTGANDAAQRGLMYVTARQYARAALAGARPLPGTVDRTTGLPSQDAADVECGDDDRR